MIKIQKCWVGNWLEDIEMHFEQNFSKKLRSNGVVARRLHY